MAVLVSDSFNRANSTTSLGTTDNAAGGTSKTWACSSATAYGINTNKAYKGSGGATLNRVAYVDASVADSVVTATFSTIGVLYLVFRVVDDNSHLYVLSNGSTNYQIGKKIASGAFTVLGTISVVPANGDIISATANGTTITVTINGANSTSVTDAYNQTATKSGFVMNDNTARLDDFQVSDLTSGTAYIVSLSDSISTLETFTKATSKSTSDSITLSETLTKSVSKPIADTVSSSDSDTIARSALLIDSITISETLSKSLNVTIADTVTTSDASGKSALSDTVTISDTIASVLGARIARAISLFGSLPSPIALLGESVAAIHLQASWTSSVSLLGSKPEPIALEGGLMTKIKQDFTMYAGDTPPLSFTMADSTSLSGATVKWSLRKGNVKGPQVLLKTNSNGLSVSGTVATISLLNADTISLEGQFYHEAEVTDVSGNVSTVMTGTVTITPSGV